MSELTENELRAGINLQVKEIERLRATAAEFIDYINRKFQAGYILSEDAI